ncbi:oligosaccharide flippase family protein [Acinetobacter sp. ANC 5600]|uniref:oligosaccharide flippase family protein n=1 Tax=Acinetobacter sp. ANC 5600 TaxID=1960940 RepID=UPI000992D1C2|nr:oligosaccharide flippase family protein [Acinetobacter sp. ANC 5600]OOV80420.1 polysaccharide biosynthesis protein [Acinetobacter sp. ANC 5600]
MKSLLDKVNAKLNAQGGFLKAVSVLVGGTAFAQLIGFLCLPILTRLYTPEDYSVLGVYVAIVAILAVISCLRFDIAIPIPENENDGKALLLLSSLSNTIFSIILYVVLFISYPYIQHYKIIDQLSYWIWLIPLGVFVSGFYSALQFWATRHKRFKDIAKTRMTQAISGNAASLAGGMFSVGFGGLIVGQLLNFSGGLFKLAVSAKKDLAVVKSSPLKATFVKYSNFPKYSTFEALANVSAIQLPLILLASYIIGPTVGYLMLAMKVLGVPMGLIGSAFSQVYLANANQYLERKTLYSYTKSIIFKIFKITIIPFVVLAVISPFIFGYIFGDNWNNVGYYILAMLPWYFMQILSSPVSMSLHVINEQKIALKLQVIGFVLRVIFLFIVLFFMVDYSIFYYFISGFIFYLLYLFVILQRLRNY